MVKYVCKDCNYTFESDAQEVKKKCTYCGEEGIIKKPSAQDILDED